MGHVSNDPTPAADPGGFSELIGLEFVEADAGYSKGNLTVTDQLKNPHGVVHGGVLYSMADTGMGAAVYPTLAADESCATIEIKINYLAPVTEGTVTCETEVINRGRTVAYMESEISDADHLVARATGSFSIFET